MTNDPADLFNDPRAVVTMEDYYSRVSKMPQHDGIEIIDGYANDPEVGKLAPKPDYGPGILTGHPEIDVGKIIRRMRYMVSQGRYDRQEITRWVDGLEDVQSTLLMSRRARRRLQRQRFEKGAR